MTSTAGISRMPGTKGSRFARVLMLMFFSGETKKDEGAGQILPVI